MTTSLDQSKINISMQSAMSQAIDYVQALQRFLEKNLSLALAELVCDFIKYAASHAHCAETTTTSGGSSGARASSWWV